MNTLMKVSTLSNAIASDRELNIERIGWAVLRVRPNFKEYGQILWSDLLGSLGHDIQMSPGSRAITNAETLAYAWLAAGNVDDLIVSGANFLPPQSLTQLCTLTSAVGIRTWLAYDIEVADEREQAEQRLGLTSVSLDNFLTIRSRSPIKTSSEQVPQFPDVPDVQFLGFLAISKAILAPDVFDSVQTRFRESRDSMRKRIRELGAVDEQAIAHELHDLTVGTNDLNEVMTIVKGAQTGAFLEGWHLRVDVSQWLQRGRVVSLSQHLSGQEWEAICRLHKPHEMSTCVLSVTGVSVEAMVDIKDSDVLDDGSSVLVDGKDLEVSPEGRSALVAQLIYRELVSAAPGRFLVQGVSDSGMNDKAAGRILKLVTRDTGVTLRGESSSRKDISGTGWTHRLGISITRLVK